MKAGAFDSLGHPRKGLCLAFEGIVERALVRRREAEQGIATLFSLLDDEVGERRGRGVAGQLRRHLGGDPGPRVRQGRAAGLREGDARAVRERPSPDGRRAGAAQRHRRHDPRPARLGRSGRTMPTARWAPASASGSAENVAITTGGVVTALAPALHAPRRAHGDLRARGPRGCDRGDGLPEDDARVRGAARAGRRSSPCAAGSTFARISRSSSAARSAASRAQPRRAPILPSRSCCRCTA